MRKASLCLFGLLAVPVFAAYTYFLTDTFASGISATTWQSNGTVAGGSTVGLSSSATNGGSVIYKNAIVDGVSGADVAYEARATLKIAGTGGTFVLYSHASTDALSGPGAQGSFYAVELTPTVTTGILGGCTMAGSAYKRVGGVVTLLTSWSGACKDGMTVRLMQRSGYFVVATSLDEFWYVADTGLATGRPGFGARALVSGSGISEARLANAEYTAPGVISSSSMRTALFDTRVDLAWTGVVDDANGAGLLRYQVYRNGVYMGNVRGAFFTDTTVAAGTTYAYTLYPQDMYLNSSSQTLTVTTPAAGLKDSRRLGVRPLGTYWGAAPENVDLQSGNLSFSLPTITAQGRGGTAVPFRLSYNSQNWRKDASGTWMLGTDIGFGWGWKLLAGSLTPVYSDWYTIHHYVYTDSSGAEYDLDVNTSGVWRGKTGHFVEFDSATKRLYFPSGNFWEFDCVARGTEMDQGTLYPTRMVDTNGNVILLRYRGGLNYGGTNGSARIAEIEDVRAVAVTGGYRTYIFHYDANSHFSSVVSEIGDGTVFTAGYTTGNALADPFTGSSFGTATRLTSWMVPGGMSFQMGYNTGSQELNQVTMPFGGTLQWVYGAKTLAGNRTQMEVTSRILNAQDGQGNKTYTLTHDDAGDLSRLAHSYTTVQDASGAADKSYSFSTAADWKLGLFTALAERKVVSGTPVSTLRSSSATWTQTANGNPYVSMTEEVIDPGVTGVEKASRTEQTVDDYGNLLERKQYGYYTPGGTPALARTYTYTYLSSSGYTSRWIRNRPVTVKVQKPGGTLMTLLTNTYDLYPFNTIQPVNYPSLLRQHDTANYGDSMIHRGNVTSSGSTGQSLSMTYNYTGTVLTTSDGLGHMSSKSMDENRNYAVPKSATGGSLTSNFTWNGYMALTSAVGPNTDTAGFSYDAYARPSQTTAANGQVTTFGYATGVPYWTRATTGTRWTKTWVDGFGRTVKVETGYNTGSTPTTVSVVDTKYAPCACTPVGKLWKSSLPYAPGATTIYWTETLYDALGRTVQVIQPNGTGTTTYSYSGAAVTVTDPAGKWKTQETDALGNLIKVTEPRPGGGTPYDTLYTYSELGKLLTVSMTRPGIGTNPATVTQTRTWVYDAATQRLTSVTHPESGTTSFVYNADGTVLRKTDAKGQKVEFTYDSDGRVTTKRRYYSSGTEDTCGRVDYYYNSQSFDATFSLNAVGRLAATATGCIGSGWRWVEMYSYTVAGAVAKKRLRMIYGSGQWLDKDVAYGYGSDGKLATVLYPDNSAPYTYSYDLMGQPIGMTGPAVPGVANVLSHVSNVTYGVAGQVIGMSYLKKVDVITSETAPDEYIPSYYTEAKSYNELFQMTRQTHTSSGFVAADLEYRFSATANNGRITSRKNYVSGEDVSYVYDELNRLISASVAGTGGWGQSFTHDGFGNLWTQAVTKGTAPSVSMSVNMANNRLNNSGWSYDANGNAATMPLVGGGSTTLTYDIENRLVNWGGTEDYAYLADNKRVWKKAPDGTETVYFYGVGGQKLVTYRFVATTPSLVRVSENVYFGGKLIRADGAAVVTDRLGSVVGRYSDTVGTVKKDFFPYGDEIGGSTSGNVDKFGTYHRDQTSGLDYADQRYFAGALSGRFLTADPYAASGGAGEPGSWNRYPYVDGDPVNHMDRRGLYSCLSTPDGLGENCGEWGWDAYMPLFPNLEIPGMACTMPGFGGGFGPITTFPSGNLSNWGLCGPAVPVLPTPINVREADCSVSAEMLNSYMHTVPAFRSTDGLPVTSRPIADLGALMMQLGEAMDIDPRLFVAVAFVESKLGGEPAALPYNNAFGIMIPGTQTKEHFSDWASGIKRVAGVLGTQIAAGNNTVALLYSGNAGAYCYGGGCSDKVDIISKHMGRMGGDPNRLGFPCHRNVEGRLVNNQ